MFVGEYVEDVDGSSEIVRIHITTFGDFGTTGFTAVHEGWFDGGTFTIITGGVVSVVGIGATRVQESGSHLVLELDKAFKAVAVAGDTVKLLRTCDGRWTTCQALGGKFRGFPHIPPSSPTNAVARKSQSPAGKK